MRKLQLPNNKKTWSIRLNRGEREEYHTIGSLDEVTKRLNEVVVYKFGRYYPGDKKKM